MMALKYTEDKYTISYTNTQRMMPLLGCWSHIFYKDKQPEPLITRKYDGKTSNASIYSLSNVGMTILLLLIPNTELSMFGGENGIRLNFHKSLIEEYNTGEYSLPESRSKGTEEELKEHKHKVNRFMCRSMSDLSDHYMFMALLYDYMNPKKPGDILVYKYRILYNICDNMNVMALYINDDHQFRSQIGRYCDGLTQYDIDHGDYDLDDYSEDHGTAMVEMDNNSDGDEVMIVSTA